MKSKQAIPIALVFVVIFVAPFLFPEDQYKYVHAPETDIYFAHISYTEAKMAGKDPIVFREGKPKSEVAVLNLPLAPGDTIQTADGGKCEIQFDTGTIIRLDNNSELKIETILAQSLSEEKKLSNLVLLYGHAYIMYRRFNRKEIFQIITPNAAVKLDHKCVVYVNVRADESTDIQVKEGKAHVLYGPDEKKLEKTKVKKRQVLTVSANSNTTQDSYEKDAEFESWNEQINENFVKLHEGKSFIPKPILKYPKSVVNFAQKYGSKHGEWSWNSYYGYVWRPYYNQIYPWGNWQPYMYGHWRELDQELFWVPDEPWGWIPYHLGLWMWDKELGWIWLPGDVFAPAWVMWDCSDEFYFWRPWSLYDWVWASYNYGAFYRGFGYSPFWSGGGYYPTYPGTAPEKEKDVQRTINKDQLKKPDSPNKVPKKLKRTYDKAVKAMKNKDQRVLDSLHEMPNKVIAVKGDDLNSLKIHAQALKLESFAGKNMERGVDSSLTQTPSQAAVNEYVGNVIIDAIREGMSLEQTINRVTPVVKSQESSLPISDRAEVQGNTNTKAIRANRSNKEHEKAVRAGFVKPKFNMRIRDWNPDVKVALRSGVNIRYSSRTNEIHCPELKISSRGLVASKGLHGTNRGKSSGITASGFSSSGSSANSGKMSSGSKSSSASSAKSGSGSKASKKK